jgi:alanyl-tRNA synthetase
MTERLYYDDARLLEFDARVISCQAAPPAAGGQARWRVWLDRTAFYPASGGQPHDTGRLGEARVAEVLEEGGEIVHVTDAALPPAMVRGAIDAGRRFDHMQQHTGQHLLSAAFLELSGLATLSFHLGRETSTVDLDARELSAAQLEAAEQLANRVIFENREVRVEYGTAAELEARGIRKAVDAGLRERLGPEARLRAIAIENFDRQPCGGTHVARTGEVGLLLLRRSEKQRGNWRVEFVCGGRALRAARADYAALAQAARLLSCGLAEAPAVLARALEERQEAHRARRRLAEEVASYRAAEMLAGAEILPDGRRVAMRIFEDADAGELREVAARIATAGNAVALLGSAGGSVVFAQSAGGPGDMSRALREAVRACGGKGGGARDLAQGSVPGPAEVRSVLERGRKAARERA